MKTIEYQGKKYSVTPAHPAADALPWHLDRPAFAELIENIRRLGFDPTRAIICHADAGIIIGGRRRELAAKIAGIEPIYEQVSWSDEEVAEWVVREDLLRRDLTPSERAASAVELAEMLPKGRPSIKGSRDPLKKSSADLAAEIGVGEKTVDRVAKVKKKAPELLNSVKEGKISAKEAARAADLPKADRVEIAASKTPKETAKEKINNAPNKPRKKVPSVDLDKPSDKTNTVLILPQIEKDPTSEQSDVGCSPQGKKPLSKPPKQDVWGIPIQPHAVDIFDAVPRFKELIAAVQHASKLFNEVASLPGGKFLTMPAVSSFRRGKKLDNGEHADRFVHEGLERALQQIKAGIPEHTVCPWHYVDAPHPDDCRTCLGANWTPALGKNISPVAEANAKKAFGVEVSNV